MSSGVSRALLMAACLAWLAGCESAIKNSSIFVRPAGSPEAAEPAAADAQAADLTAMDAKTAELKLAEAQVAAAKRDVTATAVVPIPNLPRNTAPGTGNEDPTDDLWLGKRHFQEENWGLAEKHFRRVVEHENVPAQRKAEAWIGLAASYDRLKRFDLADRAYSAAIAIVGATPEILNNQGFSYMLRGDYVRARAKFSEALERDPTNPYIQNNMDLLEKSMRTGGGRKKV
jgi:Flp pilus assembly protein TadD